MNRSTYRIAAAALLPLALAFWLKDSVGAVRDHVPARAKYQRLPIEFPRENPYSDAKAALGKTLFYETALSGSGTYSCGSCHEQTLAWGDGRARAIGDTGKTLPFRSPTLIDIWAVPVLGWDGKFPDLESVTFAPMLNPANMNFPAAEKELPSRLANKPGYGDAFRKAFGDEAITRQRVEMALATYQRTIVAPEAPFDRYIAGDAQAIGPAAKRGFALFEGKANCAACHNGPSFTDGSFHDIGTARGEDIGRGRLFAGSVKLRYAFKTPTLREVTLRAPYMHDGSVPTLREVIELYDKGGIDRPSRSEQIRPLHLSATEKTDLLAFLQTLTASSQSANGERPKR
jgi:cytochrome c peroxidase